jgi:O-antigen/teichoic acid export membrane protein/GT2 family glycosyltransferase
VTATLPEQAPAGAPPATAAAGHPVEVVRSGQLLVVSAALAAVTGFVYWVVAARLYPAEDVGRNLAAISALKLIAGIAQLNVATALLRFVPYSGAASRRVVGRGYLLAGAMTAAVAAVFVLGLGTWSADLRFLRDDPVLAVWFVASVTIWALFAAQDQVLTAVGRTGLVPIENLTFALVKLGLLVAFAVALPATGILMSWTVTTALAVAAVSGYLFSRALPRHMARRPVATPPSIRDIGGFLVLDYIASLFLFVAISGLPLLVLDRTGEVATAAFLLSWMLTYSLYLVPLAMGQSLVAHSADDGADLDADLRTLLGHSAALVVPAVVLLVVFTPAALSLFGPEYAPYETTLRLLALSAVPNLLIDLSVAAAQVRRRMRTIVATRAVQGVGVVALALYLMPRHGVAGVAAAWLIAQTATAAGIALVAFRGRRRTQRLRAGDLPPGSGAVQVSPAPATTPVTVSAIVCCYTDRRWDQLLAAVDSLRAQSTPPAEIVVVVDHNPELQERLAAARPGLFAVSNVGRQGLSGARNTGVAVASGDVVAFLDDDAVAGPDWVAAQAAAYTDPTVVGTAAVIEPEWAVGRPEWFPSEFDWVVGCSYTGLPTGTADVRNAIGAGMSMRRDAVLTVGGFDDGLGRVGTVPVGCEETELCIRLRATDPGARIVLVPGARTRHHVPADRGTFRYFRSRCWAEGISKAGVRARSDGAALGTERSYVLRTLPRGFFRALRDRRPRRALALVAGLVATSAGYLAARLVKRPARRAALGSGIRFLLATTPLIAVLGLWLTSLRGVDPGAMTDLGLVSVLPPAWFAALGAVVALFGVHVARGSSGTVLGVHLAGLIAVLHATPALLYDGPRYSWTFKHLGVVDYISRNGSLDPGEPVLGIYHSWPGFFTVAAFLSDTAGVDAATLARWAPLFFQLAFLLPAAVAFGCLTADPRRRWLALGIFALANWVGQDYFAPQALTYLLYLTVLALVLRWLPAIEDPHDVLGRIRRVHERGPLLREELCPAARRGAAVLLVALLLAIASTHQLTPVALCGALLALAWHRRSAPRWTAVAAGGVTALWMGTVGLEYLQVHAAGVLATFGRPDSNAAESLASATVAEQRVVIWAGRLLVLGVAALAAWAFLRTTRTGRSWTTALLAVAPAPLVASSYDGEIVFRVYLFALPWLALLAAGVLYRSGGPPRRRVTPPVALLLALTIPFTLAYYGKERANYFGPDERIANAWVREHAEPGSILMGGALDFPWKDSEYERFTYYGLSQLPLDRRRALSGNPEAVVAIVMAESEAMTGYLLLSDAQNAALAYGSDLPPGIQDVVARALEQSPAFRLVFANPAAKVFRLDFAAADPAYIDALLNTPLGPSPEVTP